MATFAAGLRTPFARYWLSGFLADFGDGVRLAAFPLLAAQLTRSPAAVAAVTAVQGLPWLLLGGGLGVVVDRTDRRRLMVAVDVTRAAVIVVLAAAILAHGAGLWLIYLTAFVTGAGSALRDTAAVTCVPRLVQPDRLDQANARLIAGQIVGNELAGSGAWALFNITAVTMRQRQVPAALLGRVSSLFGTVTRGTEALGALAGGALAATAGLRAPMLAGAPPLAAAVAVLAWRHRRGECEA